MRQCLRLRKMVCGMIALLMTASLVACQGDSTAPGSTTESKTAQDAQNAEPITYAYWNSPESNSDMTANVVFAALEDFNENSGYQVEIMYIPIDQYWAKMSALAAANTVPDTLIMSPGQRNKDYADAGSLMDIKPYLDQDTEWMNSFNGGAFSQVEWDGGIFAIPTYKASACLFYNTELFAQAGITETPKTWTEFLAVCQKLKDQGIQPMAMSAKDPDTWCVAMVTAYLAQRIGGIQPITDISNRVEGYTFDQESFIRAGEMTKELLDLGYIQPTAIGDSNDQATALVRTGEAAMLAQGSWAIGQINGEDSLVKGKMGVFPFPLVEGGQGEEMWMSKASCISISANTKNIDACLAWCKKLTSNDVEIAYAEQAGQIPITKVEIDITKAPPEFKYVVDALATSKGDFQFFDEMLGTTIGNEWNSTLGSICAGTKTSEQAFKDLQEFTVTNSDL